MDKPNPTRLETDAGVDGGTEANRGQRPVGGPSVSLTDVERVWAGTISTQATPGMSLKPEVTVRDPDAAAGATLVDGTPGKLVATLRTRSLSLSEGIGKASTTAAGDVDFVLSKLLGHGGMGLVYRARQVAVDREIAVKLVRPDMTNQPGVREAFFTEAVVTADLDHPNIVPIHDLGITGDGRLFYAMKEVRGVSWTKAIQEKPLAENLDILLSVGDALAFAHARDVVHRDLKPENVMLGEFGEVLVMDWGLAVSVTAEGKAKRLAAGDGPAGTPAYMAPEMARGDWAAIGPASDVYLLGAILFEIVTGKPPHTGNTVRECLLNAANNVLQPTGKSGELLRIARQAMAMEPAARYPGVKAFQAALRDYRMHAQSVALADKARTRQAALATLPEPELYRESNEIIAAFQQALELWAANAAAVHGLRQAREAFANLALNRGDLSLAQSQISAMATEVDTHMIGGTPLAPPAALASKVTIARMEAERKDRRARVTRRVAVGLGVAVIVVSASAYLITKRQRDRALAAERQAVAAERQAKTAERTALDAKARTEAANRELEQQNYLNLMTAVQAKLDAGVISQAQDLLWQTPVRLRGWEWGYQIQRCHPELLSLPTPGNCYVLSLDLSRDGRQVLVATHGPIVAAYDSADGSLRWQIKDQSGRGFSSAAFVGGDGTVVTGTLAGAVELWDAGATQPRWSRKGHNGQVLGVAVSPDARHILSWGNNDNTVRVWAAATGEPLWSRSEFTVRVLAAAFSPDGQRIAVNCLTGQLWMYDATTGEERQHFKLPFGEVTAVAFSPDGMRLAGAGTQRCVIWQTADPGKYTVLYGHSSWVAAVAFAPDGQTFLSTGADGTVRLWDVRAGKEIRRFLGHGGSVSRVSFFPGGKRFATVGYDDRCVKVWATTGTPAYRTLQVQATNVFSVAFSPDGTQLLAGCGEGNQAKLMSVASGDCVRVFKGHAASVQAVAFSADGQHVMTGSQDKAVKLWQTATGQESLTFPPQACDVVGVAFAPDGRTMLSRTGSPTTGVTVWDAVAGTMLWSQGHAGGAAYSPDGRYVLAGQWLKDAATGKQIREFSLAGPCAFSPDSRFVLVASTSGSLCLMDVATGTLVREFIGHTQQVTAVAFSPAGNRVVSGSFDETARIWDTTTGRELAAVTGGGQRVYSVALSPDSRLLALGQMGYRCLSMLESLPPTTTPEQVQEWKRERYQEWLKQNGEKKSPVTSDP